VQYLAELIIENYCMSELGLTTFAQAQGADTSYREGKPDVSELFEQQELVASSITGLLPPLSDMKVKIEVCCLCCCTELHLFGFTHTARATVCAQATALCASFALRCLSMFQTGATVCIST
jgi:hypothetical protein